MTYETVIGIEVHAQLATQTKAWCRCPVSTQAYENENICEVCTAQPGTLPASPNQQAINFAIMAGLATNCEINPVSSYDRKNYFYPDLPKGYQITQMDTPICEHGHLEIAGKKITIERIHLEEDAGKSEHDGEHSKINLNRAGTPLIEIVSGPDMRSADEAVEYLKSLHSILVYLGVCKGDMQHGNFRCDVNVSIRPAGQKEFGTRTEVKNLNSFRSVAQVIGVETQRHQDLIEAGKKVQQQTLLFDVATSSTKVLRTKSDADDYRYFPEPDLLPVHVTEARIEKLKKELPELPKEKAARLEESYGITTYDASVLVADRELADFFEQTAANTKLSAKKVANWVIGEFLRHINEMGVTPRNSSVSSSELAALLSEIEQDTISGKQAKDVLQDMFDNKRGASESIKALGMVQMSDESEIERIAQEVLDASPAEVERFKNGEKKLLGFFVGQLMKASRGKANPKAANQVLQKLLS